MMMLVIFLCLTISPVWASSDPLLGNLVESFGIRSSPETRRLKVGGNIDESRFLWPNMPAGKRSLFRIRITNDGNHVVVNPRLRINGARIPLSSDELVEDITMSSRDPLDRVLRTYYAMTQYSEHADPHMTDGDPLSYFQYHSYGMCNNTGAVQAGLWELYGYRWRDSGPHNHWSAEVEIGGKTVHLDTDTKAFYLLYDNHTIASAQDIHDDPMLVIRASHYLVYDRFPRMQDDPEVNMYFSSEKIAALYWPRPSIPPLSLNKPVKKSVRLELRPGESYGWHTGEQKYTHPLIKDPGIASVSRDVLWETHLDLAKKSHHWFLNHPKTKAELQKGRAIDLKGAIISIPYHLPFALHGMNIHLIASATPDGEGQNLPEKIRIRVITHRKTVEDQVSLKEILRGAYSLDHLVHAIPYPSTEFRIEIDGTALLSNNRKVLALSGIRINLNCLASIFAFRALRAGVNTLVYSDDAATRSVRITVEAAQEQVSLPQFPKGSLYPSENSKIPESKLKFVWPAADGAAGYHFQISAFADMRYPLSPTFDRLVKQDQMTISGEMVQFRLPWPGMLPVQKPLYWRVRPFNKDQLSGDWSKTASFRVRGPGAPEQIKITEQGGKVILSWKAAPYGTTPARYEIHASNLEGFIPVDRPHRILGLSDQNSEKRCWEDACATAWPVVPSTFVTSSRETQITLIPFTEQKLKKRLGAHWRVIAVDVEGSRSCPSPQGSLRTPMLVPTDTIVVPPGKVSYQVPVISTLGRVWIKIGYDMGLWSKPRIDFSLASNPSTQSPDWKIDRSKGLITGELKADREITLRLYIQDQYGRKDSKNIKFQAKVK